MVQCQTSLEMKAVPAAFRAVTNQIEAKPFGEVVRSMFPVAPRCPLCAVKKPAPMMTREAITPELLEARSRPRQVSAQLRERPS